DRRLPRRRLHDGAVVVGREIDLGHHRHLAGAVRASGTATAAPSAPGATPRRLRGAIAVEVGCGHRRPPRKAIATAASIPSAAVAARLYMRGRSAVGTLGSGGSP